MSGVALSVISVPAAAFAGDAEAVPPPSVVTVTVYSVGVGGASFSKMALISTLLFGMVNLLSLMLTPPLMTCHSLR